MKSYKEYTKQYIGSSDCARLLIDSWDGSEYLHFAEDGSYQAYVVDVVDGAAEIGSHYKKVAEFTDWIKIYYDNELILKISEPESTITIYRAGDFGCIIKVKSPSQLNEDTMQAIAGYMDDEIREAVHSDLAPCSEAEFLVEYVSRDPEFMATLEQEFKPIADRYIR